MPAGTILTLKRTLSQADFNRFAALSGDDNPIHVDPEFSARTRFGRTVAHGMFLYSLIHAALGQYFPGALQVRQELMFPFPSYVGEEVTVSLRVLRRDSEEHLVDLQTTVTRPGGETGCQGETTIRWVEA